MKPLKAFFVFMLIVLFLGVSLTLAGEPVLGDNKTKDSAKDTRKVQLLMPVMEPQIPDAKMKALVQWLRQSETGKTAFVLAEAMLLLERFSVEPLEQDKIQALKDLKDRVISEIVKIADSKYGQYFPADKWKKFQKSLHYSGIGVEITSAEGEQFLRKRDNFVKSLPKETRLNPDLLDKELIQFYKQHKQFLDQSAKAKLSDKGLVLKKVFPHSGAAKAGLGAYIGWSIVKVNGRALEGLTLEKASDLITGPEGTRVKLTLKNPNQLGKLKDVWVERSRVSTSWIIHKMVGPDVGYLKINSFMFRDAQLGKDLFGDQLVKAAEGLEKAGAKKIILDLRGNGGGAIMEADVLLDKLLRPGLIEFYVRGRATGETLFYSASEKKMPKIFKRLPLVLLLDRFSASASELIALSLREQGRALIIGEKSYGKGTAQITFPLLDGGVLKFTTGKIFSPVEEICVEGEGVEPDIEIRDDPATLEDEVLETAIRVLSTM
jgi:C-terminal peptidase prc